MLITTRGGDEARNKPEWTETDLQLLVLAQSKKWLSFYGVVLPMFFICMLYKVLTGDAEPRKFRMFHRARSTRVFR